MTQYTIEIRDYRGHIVATGRGHTEWQRTLLRIAAEAGIAQRSNEVIDNYFLTDEGAPWGPHHVQFGASLRTGGLSLGNTYIVSVQQA